MCTAEMRWHENMDIMYPSQVQKKSILFSYFENEVNKVHMIISYFFLDWILLKVVDLDITLLKSELQHNTFITTALR